MVTSQACMYQEAMVSETDGGSMYCRETQQGIQMHGWQDVEFEGGDLTAVLRPYLQEGP